jgi:hypothetical protein
MNDGRRDIQLPLVSLRDVGNRLTGGGLRALVKRAWAAGVSYALRQLVGSVEALERAEAPAWAKLPRIGGPPLWVNALYKTAFGRRPDRNELANCIHQLDLGASLNLLANQIVATVEFQKRHGSSQRIDLEYLVALFRDGLERQPDPETLAFWLAAGKEGVTRAKVLASDIS